MAIDISFFLNIKTGGCMSKFIVEFTKWLVIYLMRLYGAIFPNEKDMQVSTHLFYDDEYEYNSQSHNTI